MIFGKALNRALAELMTKDSRVLLLGEDIADPYGGAFKITSGLSTRFPDRVRSTPISEAAIVGIAGGLALEGYRPIVEFMFGDFLTLGFDQLLNAICKYQEMYNQQVSAPIILRTPSGGGRGYGATHSQSLEKHFLGIPNLLVLAASPWHAPADAFTALLAQNRPALYIEHKLLYSAELTLPHGGRLDSWSASFDNAPFPTLSLSPVPGEECTVTCLAYGYQALRAKRVIERLGVESNIFVELVVPTQLCPMTWPAVFESVSRTGALVTVEEGTAGWSWGTQASAEIQREHFNRLRHPTRIITSAASVLPAARHLERDRLVQEKDIEQALREASR
jgi:acetoin:2,6-dichlorophenolindophenol oxidoreductase subunit beta